MQITLIDELTPSQRDEYRHYEVWLAYLSSRYVAFFLKDYSTAFQIISKTIRFTTEERFQIRYFEGLLLWAGVDIKSIVIGEYQESIIDYIKSIELYNRLNNDFMIIPLMACLL
ncbi:MAG: hypothetical protein ACFFB2_20885 [Promethearchaeota archaeon]